MIRNINIMPNEESVLVDISDQGIGTITLNRPKVYNAFDDEIINQLIEILHDFAKNKQIKVVILRANGKHFSTGADLQWMQRMAKLDQQANLDDAKQLAKLMADLNGFPKPTIALVQGAAYGGALGLITCCDIAIATAEASFCLSEVKVGLVPAVISPYIIAAIGARSARRYFITAEKISGQTAKRLGIIHEVVSRDILQKTCDYFCNALLENAPNAILSAKQLVAHVADKPINKKLIDYTTELIAKTRISKEGQEGLNAFLEKRSPSWKNK